MRYASLLLLLTVVAAALLRPLHAQVTSAQLEETPILGEPVVVTPIVTAATSPEPVAPDPPAPTAPTGTGAPAPTSATAQVGPDTCEPNDTPAQACALPVDAVSGPYTIVPESDQDFYRLDLPQEASIQTVVTVRATAGLDLAVTARQAETLVASGTFSLTLAPAIASPVILRVENRDPRPASAEQYRIEVRREIVPPSQMPAPSGETPAPDALENNWSFETASPIAIGVVYDLSFICPEPRPDACPGGDHDYLLVPVKAGVSYLVATFDLDPGIDTVLELFWGQRSTAAMGNDDYGPGGALSGLRWLAPADGLLAVRVAPRNGGLRQLGAEGAAGYRFAVAPLASELARKLEETIRQQANIPTPTATATRAPVSQPTSGGAPASGGGSGAPASGGASAAGSSAPRDGIPAGPAIILRETVLRHEPRDGATALATLAPETIVSVRGPVSGLWISVEAEASILPGWVRWSDLRRVDEEGEPEGEPAPPESAGVTPSPMSQQPGAATPVTSPAPSTAPTSASGPGTSPARVVVTALDPALPPPAPPPIARVPFALSVIVVASDQPASRGSVPGFASPTPDLRQPIARVRVQLLNVFGDLLAEGLTDSLGAVSLSRDIWPGDALRVRMPAWGVELPLPAGQSNLIVTIPEERP